MKKTTTWEGKTQNSGLHLPSVIGGGKEIYSDRKNQRELFISKLGNRYTDFIDCFSILYICYIYSFVMEQALHDNEKQDTTQISLSYQCYIVKK